MHLRSSVASDRSRGRRCEVSPLMGPTEVELARRGTFGGPTCRSPRRSGVARGPLSRKPPPTYVPDLTTGFAGARRAVWDMDDSSLGVRSPSAYRVLAIVEYRFTSPIPSALRVFHPLSGLIPPGPGGSVSRHFRPWGLVMASRAFPTQPAVAPLDARCSLAVSASLCLPRASSMLVLAPAFCGLFVSSLSPFAFSSVHRTTLSTCSGISPDFAPTEVGADPGERPKPLTGSRARCSRRGADGSREAVRSRFRQAKACDFRALLRLSVRTRPSAVRQPTEPMLS